MPIGMGLHTAKRFYQNIYEALHKTRVLYVLIVFAVLVKLVMAGVFSSDYQNRMFEPFVQTFLTNGLKNPYEWFYQQGLSYDFPYPPVMLFVMSVSETLCLLLSGIPLFWHNILFKLPLLVMDLIVFIQICRTFPEKKLRVLVLYFMSPITLYATYMHGQLDIVPMTFLFMSFLYLTIDQSKKHYYLSVLFLALALLSKFHVAVVVPLIVLYLYKQRGFSRAAVYLTLVTALTVVGLLPFYGAGFLDGVVFNTAQSTVFSLFLSFGSLRFYVSIGAILLLYLYVMNLNFINNELLFGLGGLTFSIFLVLCVPMPGWYMWVLLFIADFVIRSNGYRHAYLCYIALNLFYLVFFVFFHSASDGSVDLYYLTTDCSFLKSDSELFRNISFTMLSAVMVYMIFLMHKFCIAGNGLYRFHDSAFVIGICGDSGTGKSTLLQHISSMFSPNNLLQIEGDGDHKWERGDSNWKNYTHLNPQANYLYRQAMDIRSLKNGESVKRVDYDHHTGQFTQKHTYRPCRFISIGGLHIFYLPQLRSIVDLKIYTEAEEDLRVMWKTNRDADSRGYSREEILRQIRSRYEDANKYIYPQKDFADVILHYFIDDEKTGSVGVRAMLNTQIDMNRFLVVLHDAGAEFTYELSDDFRYQIIEYKPSLNKHMETVDFSGLFMDIFDNGYDLLSRQFYADTSFDGVLKLILVQSIYSKLKEES